MELLEGESLAERLRKGRLPFEEALRYAIQIVDALASAHRQGIVHRDLKPGNIIITKAGAKLVDFGLAKFQQQVAPSELSSLPTEAKPEKPLTEKGTILGTFQYMAPEQLEGKEADARTDIFAFGAVVHEMLVGEKAFSGESRASLIGAILKDDPPPVSGLAPLAPRPLDWIVRRALAKQPDERWQSAADFAAALRWVGDREASEAVAPKAPVSRLGRIAPWVVAVTGVLALIVLWGLRAPPSGVVTRLSMGLTPAERLEGDRLFERPRYAAFALSPDGRTFVFSGVEEGERRLYSRRLDENESVPVPGTEGGRQPFFSPDGEWIGFLAGDGALKKTRIQGGTPVTLADLTKLDDTTSQTLLGFVSVSENLYGASWGVDGTILFGRFQGGLWRVPASGGEPTVLTTVEPSSGEFAHRLPHMLPDGKTVVFTVAIGFGSQTRIEVLSLESGERRLLLDDVSDARFAESGHLLFARRAVLLAARFDPARAELLGPSVVMVEGILQSSGSGSLGRNSGAAHYAFSRSGTLVYAEGGEYPIVERRLVWVDRRGVEETIAIEGNYASPRLSPDGEFAALWQRPGVGVWIADLSRLTRRRLHVSGLEPLFSPDGARVIFTDNQSLFSVPAEGGLEPEAIFTSDEQHPQPSSFSPDGELLAYVAFHPETNSDIWILPMSGGRTPRPFAETPAFEAYPEFSPDGRWLAYSSDESGRLEVYVQPYPGPGGTYTVSTDGGRMPMWAPDGRELFYVSDAGRLMVVSVTLGPEFSAGKPLVLFEHGYVFNNVAVRSYDVSPDGSRFLMEPQPEGSSSRPVTRLRVVLNFFEELERRAPPTNN